MVEDENLLYQAALKTVLTVKGSNPYHEWYGTSIMTRIGHKIVANVAGVINDEIGKALEKFKGLQASQAKYQTVSLKERLLKVVSLSVLPHVDDPTMFMIDMVVANAAMEPIKLTIVYTVPGAIALKGTNQRSLGTQKSGIVDSTWYDKRS